MYDPQRYTRSELAFDYDALPRQVTEAAFARYCARTAALFAPLARSWSAKANSEWLTRYYLSSKLLLAASLQYGSLEYAEASNLGVVEPYLAYYTLFNAARAWQLLMPAEPWGTKLLAPTHARLINVVETSALSIESGLGQQIGTLLRRAQSHREIYSYRFPTRGYMTTKSYQVPVDEVQLMAGLFGELAQANSELLGRALHKWVSIPYGFSPEPLEEVFSYETADGTLLIDDDDRWRIGQLVRERTLPPDLYSSIRPGHVDDFFGAWYVDEPDAFNPDRTSRSLYPFP